MKNRLIVATGLAAAAAFALFVIWLISQPAPASDGSSMPAPEAMQTAKVQIAPPADPFMNGVEPTVARLYELYTNELVIQPSECSTPAEGVTYLKVGDICTVSIDRKLYGYIYGRGLSEDFDMTSPLNSEWLFVVQLKGSEPFSIFLLKEGFLEDAQRVPSSAVGLEGDIFGFDIEPNTVTWNLDSPLADPN